MARRIRLTVAYDGTGYHGWQLQNNADSIEGELNRAIREITGEEVHVIGASRTDAGVHALGNIAVFDTESRIPGEKMFYALNPALPRDIRIVRSEEVPPDWHPRKQNCRKTYEYHISTGPVELPTKRLYAHYTFHKLDVEEMDRAAHLMTGEHDFAAFCAAGSQAETTVRTLYSADVRREGDEVIIRVCGGGFLYNMVRIIAGTLMDVGMGRKQAEDIPGIIDSLDRRKAGPTLPPQGLFLVGYEYPEETGSDGMPDSEKV